MAENKKQTQKRKPATTAKDEKDKIPSTDMLALTPEPEGKLGKQKATGKGDNKAQKKLEFEESSCSSSRYESSDDTKRTMECASQYKRDFSEAELAEDFKNLELPDNHDKVARPKEESPEPSPVDNNETTKEVTILTLNCQSLRDEETTETILEYLQKQSCDIYCLQETKCCKADWDDKEQFLHNYEHYVSTEESLGGGVGTFISKSLGHPVNLVCQSSRYYIAMQLIIEGRTFTLINVHRADGYNYDLISGIKTVIEVYNSQYNIICGDFNVVQHEQKDRKNCSSSSNSKTPTKLLKQLMTDKSLVDIWRQKNPTAEAYTRQWKDKESRLDYFLISATMEKWAGSVTIGEKKDFSDHKSVILKLKMPRQA